MATVRVTYKGTGIGSLFDLSLKAVSDSNVAYTTYEDDCGVVPDDPYTVSDIFPDGTVKVNYCWSVKTEDVKNLLIYAEALSASGDDPVFFTPRKD